MKLKVGDRVRCIRHVSYAEVGELGTIKKIDSCGDVFVCWDNDVCGWDDEKLNIKTGHGELKNINDLELVKNKCDKLIFRDNATILLKDGKRYVAKCQSGDTYDREKGLLLCLAKANGYTYNDICEMLNNAEYQGEKPNAAKSCKVREVKRPAKVGEYVKVVKSFSPDKYKKGDILKIIKVYNCELFNEVWYCHDESDNFLYENEYVVLENYKPYKITLSEFWANKGEKDMAIHCKTEAEANELLKAFDRMGQKWFSGSSYLNENGLFDVYKHDTCYSNESRYCYYDYYKDNDYGIYEFDEVDLSK